MKSFSLSITIAILFCLSAGFYSQSGAQCSQKPAAYQSKPVLKSKTRLVVGDVVATDHQGRPISGLAAQDFTVLEDGRRQKISAFSFQHPGPTVTQVSLHLPPNVVSNIPQYTASSLNVAF